MDDETREAIAVLAEGVHGQSVMIERLVEVANRSHEMTLKAAARIAALRTSVAMVVAEVALMSRDPSVKLGDLAAKLHGAVDGVSAEPDGDTDFNRELTAVFEEIVSLAEGVVASRRAC